MQTENRLKTAGPLREGCTLQGLVYRQKPWSSLAMARRNSSESTEELYGRAMVKQGLRQTLQVRGPFQSNLCVYISGA